MAKHIGIIRNKTAQGTGSPSSPRLLPLKQAANYLGLTVWAMRERVWSGQIPVVQFPGGRKQYIDVQDLEDFIKQNKRVIR
ncbi:MAG: helix-turn-helix domain-containing protein [Deltaproteobacteria bacterium]|nr:helix-turn-helix domain-containing protein [Deltaproteobacteria bacterium]